MVASTRRGVRFIDNIKYIALLKKFPHLNMGDLQKLIDKHPDANTAQLSAILSREFHK